jgi:hypothetical protein
MDPFIRRDIFGIVIAEIIKKMKEKFILSIPAGGVNEVGALSMRREWRVDNCSRMEAYLIDRRYRS